MNSAVVYAMINRLRHAADEDRLHYPQAATDVKTLIAEFERVRADNDHLRTTHAQLWSMANAPIDREARVAPIDREARVWLAALGVLQIALATIVVVLGAETHP
jgi:hypothetical protein